MIEQAKKWIAEHQGWAGIPRWWVEHGVDVANLAVTVFLAFLIHSLDTHDRHQDDALQVAFQNQQQAALRQLDDDQRLGIRQSSAESDSHQAFVLYTEIVSTTADEPRKRAVASNQTVGLTKSSLSTIYDHVLGRPKKQNAISKPLKGCETPWM